MMDAGAAIEFRKQIGATNDLIKKAKENVKRVRADIKQRGLRNPDDPDMRP